LYAAAALLPATTLTRDELFERVFCFRFFSAAAG
jgi:hypothetical protein